MHNSKVEQILNECKADLERTNQVVVGLGVTSHIVPYLNKYAIIRACGSVEVAFKAIIADYCSKRSKQQVKTFIEKKVRDSSRNPSWDAICQTLAEFDDNWTEGFKTAVKARIDQQILRDSLQSLVDARNEFAHGGNPGASIGDVIKYFEHSREILKELDKVVQ